MSLRFFIFGARFYILVAPSQSLALRSGVSYLKSSLRDLCVLLRPLRSLRPCGERVCKAINRRDAENAEIAEDAENAEFAEDAENAQDAQS